MVKPFTQANRYYMLAIVVPLVFANTLINMSFWTGFANGTLPLLVTGSWALGLTFCEFLIPIFASVIWKEKPILATLSWLVALMSITLSIVVFVFTGQSALELELKDRHETQAIQTQQDWQNETKQKLISIQLRSAQAAIDTVERYNAVNKLTTGAVVALKEVESINEAIRQDISPIPQTETLKTMSWVSRALNGISRVAELTGLDLQFALIAVLFFLSVLIELSILISCFALFHQLRPASSLVEQENEPSSTVLELPEPLATIREELIAGKYGDAPAFRNIRKNYIKLPFNELQKLRSEMITAGELSLGKGNRVRLTEELCHE